MNKFRNHSIAFCGGAFGDEGKGRIVDEYANLFSKSGKVVVYRDNGGANAGHTVEFKNGARIALHQIPSGIFCSRATVVLGKGMVLHPGDLIAEIEDVEKTAGSSHAKIMIDEMAVLSLDTHRALENTLKNWQEGGRGATGRGISPAYADVLLRQPLRIRDLMKMDKDKITAHYKLYEALLRGLGAEISTAQVASLHSKDLVTVGTIGDFLKRLQKQSEILSNYVHDLSGFIQKTWNDPKYSYVFEKAQALGLDYRWGVYPDISASDMTFDGIRMATEGVIDPDLIKLKTAVIKATYMSSVGTRILPSQMDEKSAVRIREDALEYGATTRRPRGIYHLDLVALKFFARVGAVNRLALTHMDMVYPDMPIRVCIGYEYHGKKASYRPDQEYLLNVKPVYKNFVPWDKQKLKTAKKYKDLPPEAKVFLEYISKYFSIPILLITTGPRRDQSIKLAN